MEDAEEQGGSRQGNQPVVESVSSNSLSLAETAPTKRTKRIRREKPQAPPHTETSLERRAVRNGTGDAGAISMLGERQTGNIIEA
jgi:hypothetical protein